MVSNDSPGYTVAPVYWLLLMLLRVVWILNRLSWW
nr:MAG TPA: hypothetical protein [Caudoviricetes sp.]